MLDRLVVGGLRIFVEFYVEIRRRLLGGLMKLGPVPHESPTEECGHWG